MLFIMTSVDYEPQTLKSMEEFHALLMMEVTWQRMMDWQTFDDLQSQLTE